MLSPMAVGSTLNAGDVLQVHFTTLNPACPSGPCDTLIFYPLESGSYFATGATAELFDGTSLLGTYYAATCCVPVFRSPSSQFLDAATIDFTGIDAGTINGVIDLSIATGYLTWPSPPTVPQIDLEIGHATGPGGVLLGTGLQVTDIEILPTPEPSAMVSLLAGLGFLFARRRRAAFGSTQPAPCTSRVAVEPPHPPSESRFIFRAIRNPNSIDCS